MDAIGVSVLLWCVFFLLFWKRDTLTREFLEGRTGFLGARREPAASQEEAEKLSRRTLFILFVFALVPTTVGLYRLLT